MKCKFNVVSVVGGLIVLMLVAAVAIAGTVYDREAQDLLVTTGGATWTNTVSYNPVILKHIWIERDVIGINTVLVKRVILTPAVQTQAVASIVTLASSNACFTFATNIYMKASDKLVFSSTTATGGTAIIEYEVLK